MPTPPLTITATGNLGGRFLLEFLFPLDTVVTGASATQYTLFSPSTGITVTISGVGFALDQDFNPTIGTVTGLSSGDAGGNRAEVTGMNFSSAEFFAALLAMEQDDLSPVWALLNRQPITMDVSASSTGQDLGIATLTTPITVIGSAFDDRIYGAWGDDLLQGGAGNDRIIASEGADRIFGGNGRDYITAEGDGTVVRGGNGSDIIRIANPQITLVEDARAYGGAGNDFVVAEARNGRFFGDDGNDIMGVYGQNNRADGGAGRDWIEFLGGGNSAYGGKGNDVLKSGNLSHLTGEAFNSDRNTLYGGAGNDTLVGTDNARLFGGAGADTFVFGDTTWRSSLRDRIDVRDFNAAEGDTLVLLDFLGYGDMSVDQIIAAHGRVNGEDLQLRFGSQWVTLRGANDWDAVRDSIVLAEGEAYIDGLTGPDSTLTSRLTTITQPWADEMWFA